MIGFRLTRFGQRSRLSGAIAVLVVLVAGSCGTETPPPRQAAPAATPAASSTATGSMLAVGDVAQVDAILTGNRGKWVLVNIWATWCRPCVAETPELVALHNSLKDKPFAMVGLSADLMTSPTEADALKKVEAFNTQFHIGYPMVIFSGSTDDLTGRFNLTGAIPTTILYDPQGQEIERWVGRLMAEDFTRIKARIS